MFSLLGRCFHREGVIFLTLACIVLFSNCKNDPKPNPESAQVEIEVESETQLEEVVEELDALDTMIELVALSKVNAEVSDNMDVVVTEEPTNEILKEETSEALEPIKVIDKHLYKTKIDYSKIDKNYLIALIEERLNTQRTAKGFSKLYQRRNLKDAAQDQNDYVNQLSSLTHNQEDANKNTVRDRVAHHGGRYMKVGENIQYYGFLNNIVDGEVFIFPPDYSEAADDIMKVWNESPGHYKNMMDKDFSSVGTALDWNAKLKAIFVTQVYGG